MAGATNGEKHSATLGAAEEVAELETLGVRPLFILTGHGLAGVEDLVERAEKGEYLRVELRSTDMNSEERGELVQSVKTGVSDHVCKLIGGKGDRLGLDRAGAVLE